VLGVVGGRCKDKIWVLQGKKMKHKRKPYPWGKKEWRMGLKGSEAKKKKRGGKGHPVNCTQETKPWVKGAWLPRNDWILKYTGGRRKKGGSNLKTRGPI